MQMTIEFERSDEWVAAQRLERGENVERVHRHAIEISDLSEESRRWLLALGGGEYSTMEFSRVYAYCNDEGGVSFSPRGDTRYDRDARCCFDGWAPTEADIDAAIITLRERLERDARQRADERRHEEAEAERERAEAERKRVAQAERKAQEVAARELLADELDELRGAVTEWHATCKLLAEFLHYIPHDAKIGGLRAMARERHGVSIRALAETIEDKAPVYEIFEEYPDGDDTQERDDEE
jgi:hypothetical protein